VIIHAVIIHFINNIICVDIRLIIYVSSIIMICGVLDDMKTSILIGFVFLFSAIIIYYLHERIVYLEKSVSKQNEVLSDFISNVQRQVCSAPPHHHESLDARDNIKVISQMDVNPFEKIVISDDEDSDSDDDDDDDSDSDESDTSDEDDSDDEIEVGGGGGNIKVIELVDSDKEKENNKENDTEKENENDLKEMHDHELSCSSDNVKKIELSKESDDGTASSFSSDVDLKKLSVGELRNLIVSKGNVSTQNAGKMKKQELIDALLHKV